MATRSTKQKLYDTATTITKAAEAAAKRFVKRYGAQMAGQAVNYVAKSFTDTKTKTKNQTQSKTSFKESAGYMTNRVKHYPKKESLLFQRQGVCVRQEAGGVLTDPHAVYIGHSSVPTLELGITIARTLVKQLYTKAGFDVVSFEQAPEVGTVTAGSLIGWTFRADPAANTIWSQATIALNDHNRTYEQISQTLWTGIVNNYTGSNRPYEFGRMFLRFGQPQNLEFQHDSQIDLKQTHLMFKLRSVLKFQNQTNATSDPLSTDPNVDTTEDIQNNPLVGYIYSNTGKWANYLEYKGRNASGGVVPGMIASKTTGTITCGSASLTTNELKKPPNKAWMFGCKRQGLVKLQPGEIRYSRLNFEANMSFNTFVSKFSDTLFNSLSQSGLKTEFGNVALVGLEKALSSRGANASNVSVAYQVDNTIKVALKTHRKPATAEIQLVL